MPGNLWTLSTEGSVNGSSQLIHGLGHMTCTSCHQTLGIMVPPTDAY